MRKFYWQSTPPSFPSGNSLYGLQAKGRTTLTGYGLPRTPHHRVLRIFALVTSLSYALDSATKSYISYFGSASNGTSEYRVLGNFLKIELTYNSGAAFNIGTSATPLLSAISIVAATCVLLFLRSVTSKSWACALGLLMGGVLGNLSDRIFRAPYFLRGRVVDWIKIPHWPTFNLADSSIVLSALLITTLLIKNVKPRSFDD